MRNFFKKRKEEKAKKERKAAFVTRLKSGKPRGRTRPPVRLTASTGPK